MNRKQKIIVSMTGIVLVSLILIGLTYAYFLTKITGNTNTKSISVTTANLVLEYGENTNVVQGINNAEPGYSVEKIFTATNKGNSTVTYGAALESIVNGLTRQEDLVYTLTCTSYLKEGFSLASNGTITGTVDGTCNGVTTEKQFPSTSTMSVMTTNTIDTTHTHAYKLTVTYKEMGVDQSEDMNKTFSAKVNIVDLRANADKINPYSANKNALNYQIINSALEGGTNRTIYGSEVTTYTSISGENERVLNTAPDDYGTSYYYRGTVEDNYINFAGMCWRIVRISGDGSLKLVLEDKNATCESSNYSGNWSIFGGGKNIGSFGYDSYGKGKYIALDNVTVNESGYRYVIDYFSGTPSRSDTMSENVLMSDYFYSFQINKLKNYYNMLKIGDWCLGDKGYTYNESLNKYEELSDLDASINIAKGSAFKYDSYIYLNEEYIGNYNIKCNGTKMDKFNTTTDMYVGALTASDVLYAGGNSKDNNKNYYLINSYQIDNSLNFWTLSPSSFSGESTYIYVVGNSGNIYEDKIIGSNRFRPSINLKKNIRISSGNGTKENPYEISS